MALFGIKKKKTGVDAEKKLEKKAVSKITVAKGSGMSSVLLRPHITEKSGILSQGNVYTFEVALSANKQLVKNAIKEVFKIDPLKVTIAKIMPSKKHLRGRSGYSSGGKKAYVYLKEGDKIEFI